MIFHHLNINFSPPYQMWQSGKKLYIQVVNNHFSLIQDLAQLLPACIHGRPAQQLANINSRTDYGVLLTTNLQNYINILCFEN
jgi:hypothetical protein